MPFPILFGTTVTTVLHYRADCDAMFFVFPFLFRLFHQNLSLLRFHGNKRRRLVTVTAFAERCRFDLIY